MKVAPTLQTCAVITFVASRTGLGPLQSVAAGVIIGVFVGFLCAVSDRW